MGQANRKPFHMKPWLSAQQAVDHLSVLAQESVCSEDLARLVEEYQLDLYWRRPGQRLTGNNRPDKSSPTLDQPLRLCPDNHSDWCAIVGVLRDHLALPAAPNDTPLLEDSNGNLWHITFDFNCRLEPYSSHWYPSYSELVVKRSDLEQLEVRLFARQNDVKVAALTEEPQFLLDIIAQLEKLAMAAHSDAKVGALDTRWLAQQLAARDEHFDPVALEQVLNAAGRRHNNLY